MNLNKFFDVLKTYYPDLINNRIDSRFTPFMDKINNTLTVVKTCYTNPFSIHITPHLFQRCFNRLFVIIQRGIDKIQSNRHQDFLHMLEIFYFRNILHYQHQADLPVVSSYNCLFGDKKMLVTCFYFFVFYFLHIGEFFEMQTFFAFGAFLHDAGL